MVHMCLLVLVVYCNKYVIMIIASHSMHVSIKLILYNNLLQDVSYNLEIPAMKGKSLPAITVFSKALQYMREIVVRDLNKEIDFPGRRILWILTVPAIWSHAARQLMRKAAVKVKLYTYKPYSFALNNLIINIINYNSSYLIV